MKEGFATSLPEQMVKPVTDNVRPGRDLRAASFSWCQRGLPRVRPTVLTPRATQGVVPGALAKAFEPTAFTVCGLIFQCADLL